MGFQTNRMLLTFAVACIAVLAASYAIGNANDYNPPAAPGAEGTVTLPTPCTEANPCEPIETPTAEPTATVDPVGFITPVPVGDTLVIEMPSTGTGSTARTFVPWQ
jgi:hypothetical protein